MYILHRLEIYLCLFKLHFATEIKFLLHGLSEEKHVAQNVKSIDPNEKPLTFPEQKM